jgi:hypothetical protein
MSNTKRDSERLRTRLARAEAELEIRRRATGGIDPAYLAVLVDLMDLATNPVKRPADLGGPIDTGHASSRPPSPQPNTAYDLLRRERASQRLAASLLRPKYRRLIDGVSADEAPSRSIHPAHDALSA